MLKNLLKVTMLMIIGVTLCACSFGKLTAKKLVGTYTDATNKAVMEITKNEDDSVSIKIERKTQENDVNYWTMTAKLEETKLNYADSELNRKVFNAETGEEIISIQEYKDQSGSFDAEKDKISWTGAEDEAYKGFVFVKNK